MSLKEFLKNGLQKPPTPPDEKPGVGKQVAGIFSSSWQEYAVHGMPPEMRTEQKSKKSRRKPLGDRLKALVGVAAGAIFEDIRKSMEQKTAASGDVSAERDAMPTQNGGAEPPEG